MSRHACPKLARHSRKFLLPLTFALVLAACEGNDDEDWSHLPDDQTETAKSESVRFDVHEAMALGRTAQPVPMAPSPAFRQTADTPVAGTGGDEPTDSSSSESRTNLVRISAEGALEAAANFSADRVFVGKKGVAVRLPNDKRWTLGDEPCADGPEWLVVAPGPSPCSGDPGMMVDQFLYASLEDARMRILVPLVLADGSCELICGAGVVGEDDHGKIWFQTGGYYDPEADAFGELQTTLRSFTIESVSGHFAYLFDQDTGIRQLIDTRTGRRHTASVLAYYALPGSKVLIRTHDLESQGYELIDYTDMSSSSVTFGAEQVRFTQLPEFVVAADGVVSLLQCSDETLMNGELNLCHVDGNGFATPLTSTTFVADNLTGGGPQEWNANPADNFVLHRAGDRYVVRDIDRVYVIEPHVSTVELFEGYIITHLSAAGDRLVIVGEDEYGAPVSGVYDLETGELTAVTGLTAVEEIFALE